MTDELKIYCKNSNEYIDIDGGDTLLDVYETLKSRIGDGVLCARVNNKARDLRYRVFQPKHVEFLGIDSDDGFRAYVNSLCMILYKAINDLYPGKRLMVNQSISGGYYCTFKHEKTPITAANIKAIKNRMQEIVAEDIPFVHRERLTTDVIDMMDKQGLRDKVRLLKTSKEMYSEYYKLGDLADSYDSPLVPSTGYIKVFNLVSYNDGMLLLAPDRNDPSQPAKQVEMKKMMKAYSDYIDFNVIVKVGDAGELNNVIINHQVPMLVNVAEALHNKMFARMAEEIAKRYRKGGARVVLIAGPSSSGKTTSSKRLSIQLITNYLKPKLISLDNYFVPRVDTPLDENGEYDYESIYALDLDLLNKDLNALLNGEEVPMPTYNFTTGEREFRGETLKLEENSVLILEGLHGLNPELTAQIPDEKKYRVFVSAMSTLNIDDHNWVSTADNRLIRRIVRDSKYRSIFAQETIARWPSVRRGEVKWIEPFQENADAMFNSSLIFELAAIKDQAMALLRQVPVNAPEYGEAYRLMKLLQNFESLSEYELPTTSLLREFLGGSSFHY